VSVIIFAIVFEKLQISRYNIISHVRYQKFIEQYTEQLGLSVA